MNTVLKLSVLAGTALTLSACGVAKTTGKIAAMPVKAVYKTGEFAGKSVYHTGRLTGKAALKTGEVAGKSVYHTGRLAGKGTLKTGELAGKSVYHTGRIAGTGVYETGKFAGKSAVAAGKGVYYIGTTPVRITNAALDTSARILTVTTQAVDLSGKVVTVAKDIQAMQLDAELQALKNAKDIIGVLVDKKT